jgi:cytochrome bd-type quinol oxidase subunit 2
MKELSEKTIKTLEITVGIVGGVGIWVLIYLSGQITDKLLQYGYLILFAILLIGGRALEKKTNRVFKAYRLALLISLGACLVVFALLTFVFPVIKMQ